MPAKKKTAKGAKAKKTSAKAAAQRITETEEDVRSDLSREEVNRLVQELQARQIELETRNEELRLFQEDLAESRDRYTELFDFAPVGYVTLNEKGLILEANLTLAEMLGVERTQLVRQPFSAFVVPEEQDVYYLHRRDLAETKPRGTCELRLIKKDAEPLWVRLECGCMKGPDGGRCENRCAVIDITDRKRAEEGLQESVDLYRGAIEVAGAVPYYQDYGAEKYGFVAEGIEEMTGIPPEKFTQEALDSITREIILFGNLAGLSMDEAVERARAGEGVSWRSESRIEGPDGEERWLSNAAVQVKDSRGVVIGSIGILRDITERKRADEALRKSEHKYRNILQNMEEGYFEIDIRGDFTFFNDSITKIFGYPREELLGMNNREYTTPETAAKMYRVFNRVYRTGVPADVTDYEIVRKDGEKRILELSASLLRDTEGRPMGFAGVIRDVTERKRAEEAIEEWRKRYEAAVRASGHILYDWDSDTNEVTYGGDTEGILGYTLEEMAGDVSRWEELIHPDDREGFKVSIERLLKTKEEAHLEYRVRRKNGEYAIMEDVGQFIRDVDGRAVRMIGLVKDVTERKQAEEALEESEEKLRNIVEHSTNLFYSHASNHELTYLSPQCRDFVQCDPEEAMVRWTEFATDHPVNLKGFDLTEKAIETGERQPPFELELIGKKGRKIWVEVHEAPLVKEGKTVAIVGSLTDITKRKRAEEERERLMAAIDQAGEAMMITDAEGAIQYVNPAFERITGYTREEAIGQNPRFLKSGKHDDAFYNRMWETISRGERWSGPIVNKKKDGTLYTEETTISPVRESSGVIANYVAVKRDVTHEIELENQLHQAQRMESIGQLAGGVAHDFNNILQGMFGFIEFAGRGLSPGDERLGDLMEVRKGAEKAAALTRQLLAFGRRQTLARKNIDLNGLVEGLLKMIRRIIGEDIELVFSPGHNLGIVHADPGQVEQVLMNLCVNARDAMPDGGGLVIETENAPITDENVKAQPEASPGPYVLLRVTDTGCGMDEATRERAFEPFFTTKEIGKGTGLGLSTVYGIVRQHGGLVQAESEVGKGTTFNIHFPTVDRPATEQGGATETPVRGGTETILLAEDDASVRRLVVRILEKAGYAVLATADGREAVEAFEANADKISLALLDVVMPKLSGQEIYDRIKEINPDTPILFSSGYGADAVSERVASDRNAQLIRKPYDPDSLLRGIREMLEGV